MVFISRELGSHGRTVSRRGTRAVLSLCGGWKGDSGSREEAGLQRAEARAGKRDPLGSGGQGIMLDDSVDRGTTSRTGHG